MPSGRLSEDESDVLAAAISEALAGKVRPAHMLVGVGGTASTLGAIQKRLITFDAKAVHGLELSRDNIEIIYENLAAAT